MYLFIDLLIDLVVSHKFNNQMQLIGNTKLCYRILAKTFVKHDLTALIS